MRIGLGIPNTNRKQPAPVVGGWVSDVIAQPGMIPGAAGSFTQGVFFSVPASKTCVGIRAFWSSVNTGPIPIKLALWDVVGNPIRSEVVTATSGIIQTTGAFSPYTLSAAQSVYVSVYGGSVYSAFWPNSFSMPKAYPSYSAVVGYTYFAGDNAPTNWSPSYCNPVEMILV